MAILYEKLLRETPIAVVESEELPEKIKGLYVETPSNKVILLNKNISESDEKACVLAEELGHYYMTTGNILDQSKIENRRQEKRARSWAYEKLVPLSKIVQAYLAGVENCHQLAQYLEVTDSFLIDALKRYQEKYGVSVSYGKYIIYFEPLGVLEQFEEE